MPDQNAHEAHTWNLFIWNLFIDIEEIPGGCGERHHHGAEPHSADRNEEFNARARGRKAMSDGKSIPCASACFFLSGAWLQPISFLSRKAKPLIHALSTQ